MSLAKTRELIKMVRDLAIYLKEDEIDAILLILLEALNRMEKEVNAK